uniref:Uncharacterized protein n=1 Tax=Ralstonia syzygii R24 TaxID=907261 RepID=G2ZZA7_9RALS|nr:hypothetical protein RALSY_10165 [Ralstonia syzygii R24]
MTSAPYVFDVMLQRGTGLIDIAASAQVDQRRMFGFCARSLFRIDRELQACEAIGLPEQ